MTIYVIGKCILMFNKFINRYMNKQANVLYIVFKKVNMTELIICKSIFNMILTPFKFPIFLIGIIN